MNEISAYIAGIVDSDGHITSRGGKHKETDVGVTNCSEALMKWLVDNIGGGYCEQRATCPTDCLIETASHVHRRRNIYKWRVGGYAAVILLENIFPFMVVKGDRAQEAIKHYANQLKFLERPRRRLHHMQKESVRMRGLGFSVTDIDESLFKKAHYFHGQR